MARTDNLNNFLTDVADAIKEKANIIEPINATEFDNKINEISTGIDGIIKEYKVASGENINAGDFVKFVNEYNIPNKNDTKITATDYVGEYASAVKLSDSKVFIAHEVYNGRKFLCIWYSLYNIRDFYFKTEQILS